jgi:hypothetical protein
MNEINKDWYCPLLLNNQCDNYKETRCFNCGCAKRKHPTPEQFKDEYGEEWDGAMYTKCFSEFCKHENCLYQEWNDFPCFLPRIKEECRIHIVKVCACTSFGKPDDDWRPE